MKNLRKKIFLAIGIIVLICFFNCNKVYAALQANGGTAATRNMDGWIVQIRQMEALGGTLGKNETINTTGLLATTPSNGMDCHMEKNTEYGAMIILSASSYGKPTKVANGETTTGNETGVKMNLNKEWVAAGHQLGVTTYVKNADSRYVNKDYTMTSGGKYHTGDAMNIGGWHGSGATTWCNDSWNSSDKTCGLLRAYSGSIFSYYGQSRLSGSYTNFDANCANNWASRAVVVIGENL